jgi:hypothetical protein
MEFLFCVRRSISPSVRKGSSLNIFEPSLTVGLVPRIHQHRITRYPMFIVLAVSLKLKPRE